MEGRREDVETSPLLSPLPFLRLVKWTVCFKYGLCLVYATAPKWTACSYKFPGIYVNLAFLYTMFSNVFQSFLWPRHGITPCVSKRYLSGRRFSYILIQLVLHYYSLDTNCVGLHRWHQCQCPAIFPSDTKYLSETTLVEFLQGLQMTSISNPRVSPVE